MSEKAYLTLENGKVFEGESFGASGDVIGEIVFTTGMTGYLETLTDKSYHGQIITQTFPLIGNYGVIPQDFESPHVSAVGYIVKQWCQDPSNFRNEGNLDAFLKSQNVVGLCGIDTRELTKIIRENGVMNGIISRAPFSDLEALRNYRVVDSVARVSAKTCYKEKGGGLYRVALLDVGVKESIKRELIKRGCDVAVFPHDTPAEAILETNPDGILISNGPGDPKHNPGPIREIAKLCKSGLPVMGICLGHQLIALAHGFESSKLKYGHRGANQPVKDLSTGRTFITSQNHGYAIVSESINPDVAEEWIVNVNDGTCEGIKYKNKPIFSVQFHPEACSGPLDTRFLFDEFIKVMKVNKDASR